MPFSGTRFVSSAAVPAFGSRVPACKLLIYKVLQQHRNDGTKKLELRNLGRPYILYK